MYCTNCGAPIGDRDNFCHSCGHQTPVGAAASPHTAPGYTAPRRVYRLIHDKKIAGVCAGLARYFDVDVTLIRLAVVTGIVLSGGLGLLAYVVAWIIMPVDRGAPVPHSASSAPTPAAG